MKNNSNSQICNHFFILYPARYGGRAAQRGGWLAEDDVVGEGEAHVVAVPEVLQVLHAGALEVGVEAVAGEG